MSDLQPEAQGLSLEASALREMLVKVSKFRRRGSGNPVLQLTSNALLVEWNGITEELPAMDDVHFSSIIICVSPTIFTAMAKILPKHGCITLKVSSERLFVGQTSFKCQMVQKKPPQLLPSNASQFEVLMLHYRENPSLIEEAGLKQEVEEAKERMRKSIMRAAKALKWMNISSEMLETWAVEHLQAAACGKQGRAT